MNPDSSTGLAAVAVDAQQSRGRRHPEAPPAFRDEFQRDRDRVIHCSAFRRLEYKTQVFVNHEGDMFRTRLTHSLEVAQIARSVARALALNEDLVEAIALAHDLGHTPFGHAGQKALNRCTKAYGGFEHNLHTLRVVDELESRYPDFDGLNLLFETREGILKHCRAESARRLGEVGARFLDGSSPSLEAQVANVCDEIAYNHHDIDDGLRSGILKLSMLEGHPAFASALDHARSRAPTLTGKRLRYTAIRHMLGWFVNDLITTSRERIAASDCRSVDDVRAKRMLMIDFSPEVRELHLSLKRLLYRTLYRDPRVKRFTNEAFVTVTELFEYFFECPRALPAERRPTPESGLSARVRQITDYIAGMTDRYAIAEYRRLLGSNLWTNERLTA